MKTLLKRRKRASLKFNEALHSAPVLFRIKEEAPLLWRLLSSSFFFLFSFSFFLFWLSGLEKLSVTGPVLEQPV